MNINDNKYLKEIIMKILERNTEGIQLVRYEGNSCSLESYLKRRPTEVLELLLENHREGIEKLDIEAALLVEQILRQREAEK